MELFGGSVKDRAGARPTAAGKTGELGARKRRPSEVTATLGVRLER